MSKLSLDLTSMTVSSSLLLFILALSLAPQETKAADKSIRCWECPFAPGEFPEDADELEQFEKDCLEGENLSSTHPEWNIECTGSNPVCYKDFYEVRKDLNGNLKPVTFRGCIEDIKAAPYFLDENDICDYPGDNVMEVNQAYCLCQNDLCNGSNQQTISTWTTLTFAAGVCIFKKLAL